MSSVDDLSRSLGFAGMSHPDVVRASRPELFERDPRPLLVGMNNPLSDRPGYALWPEPERCTGWHLWRMLHDRTGASPRDYVRAFARANLVVGPWDPHRATDLAHELQESGVLRGRRVILLGREVRRAFALPAQLILPIEREGVRFHQVPHPSGLNRWYNDVNNRDVVASFLGVVFKEGMWAVEAGAREEKT